MSTRLPDPRILPSAPGVTIWRSHLAVTKPRVVLLMAVTVVAGMMLARPAAVPAGVLLAGTAGISLVAAGGAALNHLVDQRVDALMARTRHRPLPSGTLSRAQVARFAALLSCTGMALLLAWTNTLCALLTLASLLGYALLYSVLLKPRTAQNIVIGGAAGAAPPLLGWVAVTGQVDAGALLLFAIILTWTPPHFWALAIHRRDDYARAGLPMLPVTQGVPYTAKCILNYAWLLWAVSLLPVLIGMSGGLYLIGALGLGGRFVALARRLRHDMAMAMPTFRYSIIYLASLFALLVIDHHLARLWQVLRPWMN
jgi:protoheme IX farnesyltransferase